MDFKSTIVTLPGIGGSAPQHWQSIWEKQFGFARVEQKDWETPDCGEWINTLAAYLQKFDPAAVIIVAHSAACVMVAHWAQQQQVKLKGALLVAPADADAITFPLGTTGFKPMPLIKLPFPSIVVTSTNDHFVTTARAVKFAEAWGSELINIGEAGHINTASGFGEWDEGLEILKRLDNR